tara:strand:+ start:951 stop:1406 length:456 start_codon:yes stop_codon:yes gene_type:complete
MYPYITFLGNVRKRIMADGSTVNGIPLPKLTGVYLKIKAERERLSTEFRETDDKLVSEQNKIKGALLDYLKENDIKSVKTDAGTFYRTVKQKYWTNDWENMHKFILEHEVPEFLDKRLNQKNVKEFLEEHPDLLPKGLNVDAEFALTIRKA